MNVAGNSLAAVPTSVAAISGAIIIVAINTTAPAAKINPMTTRLVILVFITATPP